MKVARKVILVTFVLGLITLQSGGALGENKNPPKPFNWNFTDTDIAKVIEAVAEYTGKNFDIDPKVQGKVNLITAKEIPPELAYEILEAILASRGFALVPVVDGNLIRVVPATDAVTAPIPTTVGKEVPAEAYENLLTQVLQVQFAQATDLVAVLEPLKSQAGHIQAYAPANLLIITDRASQVKRLMNIVDTIDVPGFDEQWEIIPLKYQSADLLAQTITDVLSEEATALAAGQRVPTPPAPRPRVPTRRTPQVAEIVGAARTPLRIIPDTWTNSLIVVAVESMMVKVKKLVEQLDVETPFEEGNVHVYIVKNADVVEIADTLESLISGTASAGARGQQPGQPAALGEVQAFAKEVRISPYEPTNALLITASPQDWQILQSVLEKIDIPERQVYVEAVIMEVTITDGVTVGVDLAMFGEDDFVAASTFGDLANFIVQGPLGFTGGLAGMLKSNIDMSIPLPDGTTTTISVPRVPVLLTAIQTVTDLEVLSAPTLLTTKGTSQRATTPTTGERTAFGQRTSTRGRSASTITVGKDVPVVRGTARPLSQEAISPTLYNTVGRQKVGVVLEVTPHIIADDYVKLEIRVEVSDTIVSDIGIDPNISGPTFSVSEILDTVVIQDGYMGILGGLMSQKAEEGRSQIPILGDIPGLGFFFRKTLRMKDKRNLVVIITPHIIKSGEDLDQLTARHREEYDLRNLRMRHDLNFWRRVFKKEERPKRPPATEKTTHVRGENADRVLGRKLDW